LTTRHARHTKSGRHRSRAQSRCLHSSRTTPIRARTSTNSAHTSPAGVRLSKQAKSSPSARAVLPGLYLGSS